MDEQVKVIFWAKTEKVGTVRTTRIYPCDEEDDINEFSDMVEDELTVWACSDAVRPFSVIEYGMRIRK